MRIMSVVILTYWMFSKEKNEQNVYNVISRASTILHSFLLNILILSEGSVELSTDIGNLVINSLYMCSRVYCRQQNLYTWHPEINFERIEFWNYAKFMENECDILSLDFKFNRDYKTYLTVFTKLQNMLILPFKEHEFKS